MIKIWADQSSSYVDIVFVYFRCYGMAIKQYGENSSLWHDLGVNLFYQSQMSSGTQAHHLAGKAVNSLQKALTLQSDNHRHWTTLGVIAASKGTTWESKI